MKRKQHSLSTLSNNVEAGEDGGAQSAGSRRLLVALQHTVSHAVDRLSDEKERSPCLGRGGVTGERSGRRFVMWGSRRHVALDALMACWGLGTWLGVNGLYVQLPVLVQQMPEGWALPASMALAVQLANTGLLGYALLRLLRPQASDSPYIYALLAVGTTSLTLNAFLYTSTVTMGGTQRSLAFLVLTFFAALVGCTSSVLFYPYLRHFRDVYLATYLVGEGLSGLIPSVLALIQGVGGEPECVPSADNSTLEAHYPPARFGSMTFLLVLGGLSAASLVSFMAIDRCGAFRSERVEAAAVVKEDEAQLPRESLARGPWPAVLALMGVLNALSNGVLPSVQSFSCMPYGVRAYHLAVTLSAMANPAACLAGVWLRPLGARALAALLSAAALPLAYILTTAAMSPAPPLHAHAAGVTLIVCTWVCASACVSYGRMWVYGWARRGGARGMRAVGAATQLGSALGSALLFALVNYAHVFTEPAACPPL